MSQKLLSLLMILLLAGAAAAQSATAKDTENAAKLEKDAVEFLRETSAEVGNLRSMENRVSFNAELASLMWFHDEKEAKAMYGGVVSDFKQLVAQFDAAMNSAATPGDDDMNSPGGFFGGYGRSKVERKFRIAMAVRQQIAMSLADHAPDLAYNFFYDSLNLITNPQFRKETEQSDKYFESQLLAQIAASDANKAVAYGKESIKAGIEMSHVDLLKKIYAKDADKGIEFGAELLSRIKSDKANVKNLYVFDALLTYGSTNLSESKTTGGKKPIYSSGDLRDIADQLAQTVLDTKDTVPGFEGRRYASVVEKYSPSRAAQIRAKFPANKMGSNSPYDPEVDYRTAIASNAMANVANSASNSNSMSEYLRQKKESEDREKTQKQMMDDVQSIGTKALPKEERDKIVAQTRKIISETPGKDKKLLALGMLAAQVAKAGDKELAGAIMLDAERLVNPQPKNYQDFLYSWMLCGAYAQTDPDKAFPMLESTILRANDTIAAFVKVGEFLDTNDEMIVDGEVQVGMFGGSMIRGLTGELGMASGTIQTLAKADFTKTKALANAFDRTEVRVLAKMMVLRAVLDKRTDAERIRKQQANGDGLVDTEPLPDN
ncbi:MAG: hypothetical protein ABJA02_11270 [Acidobacteriota bacterium]